MRGATAMESEFELLISFRTPGGFKLCAQYFLGNDRTFAEDVFAGLSGRKDADDNAPLHLDLTEKTGNIPVKIKTLGCKFGELAGNCRSITRELCRAYAIEPDDNKLWNLNSNDHENDE